MKSNLFYLFLFVTLFCSCDCEHERECVAFYYDTDLWNTTIDEEEDISFVSEMGDVLSFEFSNVISNEPYVAYRTGGCPSTNDVGCDFTKSYFYVAADSSLEMKIYFDQIEVNNQSLEEQQVFYHMEIREDLEGRFLPLHGFAIEPSYDRINDADVFYDSLTLNDKIYYDIIQSQVDTGSYDLSNANYFWKLTASRGKGIVSLTNKDGVEYFLME